MAKTLCKSFRRDGSPCQGQGLEQFDGYCIALASADTIRAWRARGGNASSTPPGPTTASPDDSKSSSKR